MARKTKEDSQLTKDAILDAAELVIVQNGISYATMADIADTAKISRGAVYGHYKGKIEVALAMINRALDTIVPPVKQPDETNLNYIYRLGIHNLHLVVDPSSVQRIFYILYIRIDDSKELMERRRAWESVHFNRLKFWLNEAIKAKELPDNTDLHLAALYVQALLDGVFCTLFWGDYCPDNKWEVVEQLYDIGFEGLRTSNKFCLKSSSIQSA